METLVNDYLTQINGAAAADKEDTTDHVFEMRKMRQMFASSFYDCMINVNKYTTASCGK